MPRRWCVPPALLHEPDESLEGTGVLDELRGPLGLVLWQSLRDVTLWAATPAGEREGLFAASAAAARLNDLLAAGLEYVLEVPLTTLAAVLGAPAAASPPIVSVVCLRISEWAERRGAMATAMAYAQAAALVSPEDPGPALETGRLALRWRRDSRAATWLRRCIGLARRRREWLDYGQAYVELGVLYERRGELRRARHYFARAVRVARRHGMLELRGIALHGLVRAEMGRGSLEEAERYGAAALRALGRTNPRTPALLHDLAELWVRRGEHERAIPVLQQLLPNRIDPVDRAWTLALLANAAAAAGDTVLYEESWSDAWAVITGRPESVGKHLRTLPVLARASALLRDWTHVEQAVLLAGAHVNSHREPRLAAPRQPRTVGR